MTTLDETGQHEDPVWLRALQLVEAITPENFHHFREVGNLHDWCESVRSGIRAYLSTTSAGVTEEQVEAACAAYQAAYPDGTSRAGQQGMRAALEASRVAPVSQKEADDDLIPNRSDLVEHDQRTAAWAKATIGQKEAVLVGFIDPHATDAKSSVGERLNFWCSPVRRGAFTQPVYASPAHAGEPRIKALIWRPHVARAGWLVADVHPGSYFAWELAGIGYWSHGSIVGREVLGGIDAAKAACEADYERRIRSALHPTPTPVSAPVGESFDMRAHLQRQRDWSGQTFGPGPRTKGVVDHIRKELCEIEADPSDISEWIDVTILALDGAWRAGHTPDQIIAALVAKQVKNEARNWPDWRTSDPDKAIEHVRTPAVEGK